MIETQRAGDFSKVELNEAPIERSWIVEGAPRARNAVIGASKDRSTTTILWECSEGRFNWHYDFDEAIYFLEGSVTIMRPGEAERSYGPGDWIHFSVGDSALWTVKGVIRKVAFCRQPPPKPVAAALRAYRGVRRRVQAFAKGAPSAPSLMGA